MKLLKNYWKLWRYPEALMLYPQFNELVALKNKKWNAKHPSSRSVKMTARGNHHSPFRGQGLEFDAVREYVPGDDIRTIDWRVTARSGSPHIKLFKEERERPLILCLDMNASMRFGTRNTFKSVQGARVAALLGWQGLAQHERISACLYGDVPNGIQFFPPQRTHHSLCRILKMATQPFPESSPVPLEKALVHLSKSVHTGSLLYVISDFMEIDFDGRGLKAVKKKCEMVFIAINDLAEKNLYPMGTLGFASEQKERVYVNTESLVGQKTYAAQWEKNRGKLYEMTARLKIPLIELTTESDVCKEVMMGLKNMAKKR